ncbi:MAG: type II toxin-antitoxin system RelE/ParE family toxin [Caulobacter sp.]|nr:type II toxin-antitoxin system RelE/ParE family toxin [Caulobacter sp.]
MTRRLRISNSAKRDLSRLEDFLAEKAPAAANRAAKLITEAMLSLREFPERGYACPLPGVREWPVRFGRSGYIVRYLVQPDTVTILRIFHGLEDRQT